MNTRKSHRWSLRVVGLLAGAVAAAGLVACSGITSGDIGESVGLYQLTLQPCTDTAAPRPGWVNCRATAYLSVTATVSSGYLSAYVQYPTAGAYYYGQVKVASSVPGNVTVALTNPYVASCAATYPTSLKVYDGQVGDANARLLKSLPLTLHTIC